MKSPEGTKTTIMKLKRIAALSAANSEMEFTHVIHHINEESLRTCFQELDGKKAIGKDGVDKASYGKKLDENLQNLMERMKRMAYIPGPIREVEIPKEGKPGAKRKLGISNFEDKLVQKMMHKVLSSIYEPLFHKDMYGFRAGRSCHDAIEALHAHLNTHRVETVIDVDIANYFGSIPHKEVIKVIQKKIKDPRLLRYLMRMFKSGMLTEGDLKVSEEGVVQGSMCSPIIANIFSHEVIVQWIEEMVKPNCAGEVKLILYADDMVICCQYEKDAIRIRKALSRRLEKYGLKVNEEKTKLVNFSTRKQKQGQAQETFDFLGFTFYLGKSRKGYYIVKVKTAGKRFRKKLKRANEWAHAIRNKKRLMEIMKLTVAKVRGHVQYYGVSHNYAKVSEFIYRVKQILFKWLNRRSQRKSFTWEKYEKLLRKVNFPEAKIYHKLF